MTTEQLDQILGDIDLPKPFELYNCPQMISRPWGTMYSFAIAREVDEGGRMVQEVGGVEYPCLISNEGAELGCPKLRVVYVRERRPSGQTEWPTYGILFQVDELLTEEEVRSKVGKAVSLMESSSLIQLHGGRDANNN